MKKYLFAGSVLMLLLSGCSGNGKDYSAVAQCLTEKGVKFYGAYWCPHCSDQKKIFGDAMKYIDYVECDEGGENANPDACRAAGISRYPTWTFPGQDNVEGLLQPEELAKKVNCEATPAAGTQEMAVTQETQSKGLTSASLSPDAFEDVNVSMTKNGFEPAEITIQAGTKVIFTNNDTVDRWPASGPHPAHTICPYFDPKRAIEPGKTAEFTFYSTATCPYHDHLNPERKGLVTVE